MSPHYYLGHGPLIPDDWGAGPEYPGDRRVTTGHATRIGAWHVATLVGHAARFRFRCECGAKGPERGHRFQAAQDEADHRDEVAL